MYKLIAIDLDGTMLNSYGEVTKKTKEKLQKKIQEGTQIVIASGRTIPSITPIAEEIGNIRYIIAGNGALIYDMEEDKIIYDKSIEKNKILEIIRKCEENSIFYTVYTEKEIITKSLKYNVLYYYKTNLQKIEEKRTKIKIVENIEEYIKQSEDTKYLKIMICDETRLIFNSIINKLQEIKDIEILDVGHMSRKIIKDGTDEFALEYYYTEISKENVDKWYALEELMNVVHINKEEIIAIGDNVNDKKMIKEAGLGIAMGQSAPDIKEVADKVTLSNDEDGIEQVI